MPSAHGPPTALCPESMRRRLSRPPSGGMGAVSRAGMGSPPSPLPRHPGRNPRRRCLRRTGGNPTQAMSESDRPQHLNRFRRPWLMNLRTPTSSYSALSDAPGSCARKLRHSRLEELSADPHPSLVLQYREAIDVPTPGRGRENHRAQSATHGQDISDETVPTLGEEQERS